MTDQLTADELGDDAADAVGSTSEDVLDVADGGDADDPTPEAAPSGNEPRRRRKRVSKWDRPPEPHDWRFWVGNLGRVLIAMGLLLFGFVAYQLWGTGIETARAQNRLENQFEEILAERGVEVDESAAADAPVTDTDDESTTDAGSDLETAPAADPGNGDGGDAADDDDELDIVVGEVTGSTPIAMDLAAEAVVQEPIPQPFRGDPLLRLEIPAIGRDDIVVPGVTLDDLKDGPGHYPDSPLPGQLGNASIAGHRTTYGAPFINVDKLVAGDEIVATLLNGDRFVYEVTFVEVVAASDYHVVTTTNPNIAELTLTSCHPKYTARDRIVVHSVLNQDKSSNVGFPTFYSLEAPEEGEIVADDPVLDPNDIEITGPDSALGESDDAATEGAADAPDPVAGTDTGTGTDTDQDVEDAGAVADDGASPSESAGDDEPRPVTDDELAAATAATAAQAPTQVDAFSHGWFEDTAAWPQIILWALALIAIWVLSYQVAKRFRRYSVGILVGIVPFLFCLYFFYQNVNRLLPPGI